MKNKTKSYFSNRTTAEVARLDPEIVTEQNGLVKMLTGLESDESIQLGDENYQVRIIPERFYQTKGSDGSGAFAGAQCYKKGKLLMLSNPRTIDGAHNSSLTPLNYRERAFERSLYPYADNEQKIDAIGLGWHPVLGTDRRKRKLPFVWDLEGHKIFSYAENETAFINSDGNAEAGIELRLSGCRDLPFSPAKAKREGQTIIARVPSRRKKHSRYELKLLHVPTEGVTERRSVAYSLNSEFDGNPSEHEMWGNIRYTRMDDLEGSNISTFYPQAVAAYIGAIKHFNKKGNLTPLEMSQIPLVSREAASFYTKLNNNLVIHDETLKSKRKLRKPNIAEKSILLARAAAVLGASPETGFNRIFYWDGPTDGKIKDFDWTI